MLRAVLSGGMSFPDILAYVISSLIILFLVLPLHECAHGLIANKLGDPTAKYQRRLTLNPFHHVDWMGAAALLLVGFGWARPVPVDMRYFKHPKRDMALVALAGPVSNLLAALLASFLYSFTIFIGTHIILTQTSLAILNFLLTVFVFLLNINVSLAVFNLIPIPPLDGSRILTAFLPNRVYYQLMRYERYFTFLIFLLCFSGSVITPVIGKVSDTVTYAFVGLTNAIFGL